MPKLTLIALIAGLFFALGGPVGCEEKGPAEKAGERMDDATERTGEKIEDMGDEIEDMTDD